MTPTQPKAPQLSKPFPALCRDCKHSTPNASHSRSLDCRHPVVNAADPWALASSIQGRGTDCRAERERTSQTAKCGIRAKLFEPKDRATS